VSEKKALGLQVLWSDKQCTRLVTIVCKDDSAPRSSDLVLAVAVHTDATTTPCDVETTVLVSFRKAIKRF
jgi:hypothetical protein